MSTILDVAIREGRWVTYTASLDREGKFDRRKILDILMTLCEEMERMEQEIERMKSSPLQIVTPGNVPQELEKELAEADERQKRWLAASAEDKKVMLREMDETVETTTLHICPVCEKSFSTPLALMGHQRSHKDGTSKA